MNKYVKTIILGVMLGYFMPVQAQAAEVEVTWVEPENYRDIHQGEHGRKDFHKKMFKDFDKHFAKLAKTLPKKYTLKVNVTDLDLAGNITRAGAKWGTQMKMVRSIENRISDATRIDLSFELLDENKAVIFSGENNLERMVTKIKGSMRDRTRSFSFEKKMIDDWFESVFVNVIVK